MAEGVNGMIIERHLITCRVEIKPNLALCADERPRTNGAGSGLLTEHR